MEAYQQFLERCGSHRTHALGACDVDGATFRGDHDGWLAALTRTIGGAMVGAASKEKDHEQRRNVR